MRTPMLRGRRAGSSPATTRKSCRGSRGCGRTRRTRPDHGRRPHRHDGVERSGHRRQAGVGRVAVELRRVAGDPLHRGVTNHGVPDRHLGGLRCENRRCPSSSASPRVRSVGSLAAHQPAIGVGTGVVGDPRPVWCPKAGCQQRGSQRSNPGIDGRSSEYDGQHIVAQRSWPVTPCELAAIAINARSGTPLALPPRRGAPFPPASHSLTVSAWGWICLVGCVSGSTSWSRHHHIVVSVAAGEVGSNGPLATAWGPHRHRARRRRPDQPAHLGLRRWPGRSSAGPRSLTPPSPPDGGPRLPQRPSISLDNGVLARRLDSAFRVSRPPGGGSP